MKDKEILNNYCEKECKDFLQCGYSNKKRCPCRKGIKYGLAEGRKEGYELGKNNERKSQCGKKNYERYIARLEKEIAELSNSVTELTNTKTELSNTKTELKSKITELENRLQEFSGCECCKSLHTKDKCRSCDDTLCNWEFEY